MIVGIDAGNWEVKVCHEGGAFKFPSTLGEYRERNLEQAHGDYDWSFDYQGRKGFAGTLALHESEFGSSMMGDTKAHNDTKLRVLLALHSLGKQTYQIVVGQPIGQHTKTEKLKIKAMLLGEHIITVNGQRGKFMVEQVEVAAEGGVAIWASPRMGLVRMLDIGSGTVNAATLQDLRYVDKDSFSLAFGRNTTKSQDLEAMARYIATETLKKWHTNDTVILCGGSAKDILPHIQNYFGKAEIISFEHCGKMMHPVYANACGLYSIARGLYE